MRFIVITGISGAGKSLVAKHLEDAGFFCIDNLPPLLIPKISEICSGNCRRMDKIALVIDVRGGELLNDLFPALESLAAEGHTYEILFMEASDKALIKRYRNQGGPILLRRKEGFLKVFRRNAVYCRKSRTGPTM